MNLETELAKALDRAFHKASSKTPINLERAIRYSLMAPGKRIRPRIALATAELLGLEDKSVISPALAIEMIHCFTLIHDDLPCMDDDDFRRGQPSCHKKFDEATALLAGDALLAMGIEVFLECQPYFAFNRVFSALKLLLEAIGPRGVIGGQSAEALLGPESSLAALREMHALKTGALFMISILIPAELAGIVTTSKEGVALHGFARELGQAFQIADDLEDKEKEADPTSVLFYQSEIEAATSASKGLGEAVKTVERTWNSRGAKLVQIAQEVLGKWSTQV